MSFAFPGKDNVRKVLNLWHAGSCWWISRLGVSGMAKRILTAVCLHLVTSQPFIKARLSIIFKLFLMQKDVGPAMVKR